MANVLAEINDEFGVLSEKIRGSLVHVDHGAGAGTIWHPEGLILTNAHVLQRRRVSVTMRDGTEHEAHLLAIDKRRDLAALSVEADALPTIELGNSRDLQPGEWVVAYGHPWGVPGAATAGVVIGEHRDGPKGKDWLAVSLHYRPGHSGGPLVDTAGRLVGINTIMAGPDVGLAIPVHEIKRFLKEKLN